ncbi:uncharacterized protein LOC131634042 [Vicia villosa]|uniref:uncharacterized protein LOC131634042 n=1 Tax=Vicia villosa TaxID=3911 RepID=UPI00273CE48B|nr:uncharacterized protein LOC131634042 [Vicia villosa]
MVSLEALVWPGRKKDGMDVQFLSKENQFIHSRIKDQSDKEWLFTAIYASPNNDNRKIMLEDIRRIAEDVKGPRLLARDFNDIAYNIDKKGGTLTSSSKCKLFRDRINECNLLHMETVGLKFTWRGPLFHGGQRIYEKLDRVPSNEE